MKTAARAWMSWQAKPNQDSRKAIAVNQRKNACP